MTNTFGFPLSVNIFIFLQYRRIVSLDIEYEVGSLFLQHLKTVVLIEVLVKAETGLENSTQMTNYQPLLENDSGQETSAYFFIPSTLGELK